MKFKTLCVSMLALSLMACSEDALTPQYNQNTPFAIPDAETLQKQPFILVTGDWINETRNIVIHIDSVGYFVMRDSGNAQITEQTGKLKDVSKSYNLNELRYELYNSQKQPMNLAFGVRQLDEKKHYLVLLDGSTSTPFYPNKD